MCEIKVACSFLSHTKIFWETKGSHSVLVQRHYYDSTPTPSPPHGTLFPSKVKKRQKSDKTSRKKGSLSLSLSLLEEEVESWKRFPFSPSVVFGCVCCVPRALLFSFEPVFDHPRWRVSIAVRIHDTNIPTSSRCTVVRLGNTSLCFETVQASLVHSSYTCLYSVLCFW